MRKDLFCFDSSQNIKNYFISFHIRSDYRRSVELNNILIRINEAGFIFEWLKDFEYQVPPVGAVLIKQHFRGAFLLYVSILILVLIVASLEQIIHWKCHHANESKYWILAEKLIDGQRHFFLLDKS